MRGLIIILSEFAFANAKFNFVQRLFPPHTPTLTLASDGQRAAADTNRSMLGSGLCALLQPVRVGFVTDA
eukprot:scaffold17290_cov157-Isochrysis_galbana.AAC.1